MRAKRSGGVPELRYPPDLPITRHREDIVAALRAHPVGLIPQGGISIAMAVSAVLMYSDLRIQGVDGEAILFAVIVMGVALAELTGPFLTTRLLVRAGEIPQEAAAGVDGNRPPAM